MDTIRVWTDHLVFKTEIEEKIEDTHLIIGYEDHGDEFIFVETKDGKQYTYGFWCDRNYQDNYEKLIAFDEDRLNRLGYIRLPKLFKKRDTNNSLSNELYRTLSRVINKEDRPKSSFLLESYLNNIIREFNKASTSDIQYDYERYRQTLLDTISKYDEFNTEENRNLIEKLPMSSKIDGVDGIAAKRIESKINSLWFDSLNFVIKDEKKLDIKDDVILVESCDYDEWGYSSEGLYFDQFDDDAESKIHDECLKDIQEHIDNLLSIKARLGDLNLRALINVRDQLDEMNTEVWIPEPDDV